MHQGRRMLSEVCKRNLSCRGNGLEFVPIRHILLDGHLLHIAASSKGTNLSDRAS